MKRFNCLSKNQFRLLKINSRLKKKLSASILQMNDKRIGIVSVSHILINKDLKHAKIYVYFLNSISIKNTILILNRSSSYLRNMIAKDGGFNNTPRLSFHYDKSVLVNNRINSLLKR